jgi:hypothetical protein
MVPFQYRPVLASVNATARRRLRGAWQDLNDRANVAIRFAGRGRDANDVDPVAVAGEQEAAIGRCGDVDATGVDVEIADVDTNRKFAGRERRHIHGHASRFGAGDGGIAVADGDARGGIAASMPRGFERDGDGLAGSGGTEVDALLRAGGRTGDDGG